jgi:tellurium resistance protein TerD
MEKNIDKGQTVDLDTGEFDLSNVVIGLGWDIKKQNSGLMGRLFSQKKDDFDLDVTCFLLNPNGKVSKLGNDKLIGGDVIFFNNMRHISGSIRLNGDNRSGAGDGDDEQIIARLSEMDKEIDRLVFVVTIFEGIKKGQHFGTVNNAFIHATDANGKQMVRYQLSGNAYHNKRTMLFAEVYRYEGHWNFRAIGEGYEFDSFVHLLRNYVG